MTLKNLSFFRETLQGLGKEAISWAPTAIGLATNHPTVLTIGEVGRAAFDLHAAFKSKSRADKIFFCSKAAISLITPCIYYPNLIPKLSITTRTCFALVIGGHNLIRGAAEIVSITKNLSLASLKHMPDKKENNKGNLYARILGNALRLTLGIYRVYTGFNMMNNAYSHLFSKKEDYLMLPPKLDSKYKREALYSIQPSNALFEAGLKDKYTEFNSQTVQIIDRRQCFPETGQYHPYDVAFYDKIASSPDVSTIQSLKNFPEQRCIGTLYLRSEDTNYLHPAHDGYLRAEDTLPIGEISSLTGEKLLNDGRVWYRTIEKVEDICRQIKDVHKSGGKIKRLILVGHGDNQEILLSQKNSNVQDISKRFFSYSSGLLRIPKKHYTPKMKEENWNLFDSKNLVNPTAINDSMKNYSINKLTQFPKNGCLNDLEPNADIVLIGCNAGQGRDNIADSLAKQAPDHQVIAPNTPLLMSYLKGEKIGKNLKFYFENSKGKNITYIALAKKILN